MDIAIVVSAVRRVAPRARQEYMAALLAGAAVLEQYGLTTPLRLAHFFAQVLHETNGLTIVRESGAYSAKRILEIFGVGRHSAGVTPQEAKTLAGNGPALFERVYGQGNARKAKELGNTTGASGNYPGDGWYFRGNGMMQTTGRGAHRRLGKALKLGTLFEDHPEAVTDAEHALLPALAEWAEGNLNDAADRNDIRAITRRINGGFNGYADRVEWFNRIWPLLRDASKPEESWKVAKVDPEIRKLQGNLVKLGYDIKVDGRFGPATAKAVRDFQSKNGLTPDGAPGPITLKAIETRLAAPAYAPPPAIPDADAPPAGAKSVLSGLMSTGAAGGVDSIAPTIQDAAQQLAPHADAIPVLKFVVAGLTILGVGLTLYGAARLFLPSLFRKSVAVPQ